jgi:NADPH-dependent glutamate synthase beta subunit-like oxidoreductase/Pyruvate/2-oxoacid:ferredoxin oxidoreductase delta subunit
MSEYRPVLRRDDPFVPISSTNSLAFKTGSQRSERPVFINKTAPCRQACPIGIDIPTAFHLASQGDLDGALRTYLQDNPLPGVCGRVCYHPCERECNRGDFDESVNIRSFERFLADHGRADIAGDVPIHSRRETIAVVGSGPAGLSAAYHLVRRGYHVTIFEGRSELGGMLRYGIPAYRLPRVILDREIRRISSLGIAIDRETTIGGEVSWNDLKAFDAIFIAMGLQSGKVLFETKGVEDRILTGLDFLAYPHQWGLDDDTLTTVIIGGGNVAIDVARTLLRLRNGNGSNIRVICPESRDQMPALPEEITEAEEEGITILNGWAPEELHYERGKIKSLDFFRARVTVNKVSGVVKISRVGKRTLTHAVDTLIMAIGQEMRSETLPVGMQTAHGFIRVDRFTRTALPNIFAGGDVIGGMAFVADAIATGKMGALAISCYLEGKDIETEFKAHRIGQGNTFCFERLVTAPQEDACDLSRLVTFGNINTLFFDARTRNDPERRGVEGRKKTFDEVNKGLEPAHIEAEIGRCFQCGTCADCENCLDFCPDLSIIRDAKQGIYRFDSDYCKGCGVCSVACPRGVVEMVEETP